ncbi:MAG: tyrosine-type recombinase/integrase [Desulfatibacillum sp.]|nr:tyrosine-type recombinase/integrase [Desulfatibacillum sp.]
MPWRKYPFKEEKYGPTYKVPRGVRIRRDSRHMWAVYVSKNNQRKNVSIGKGTEGLAKAIRVNEDPYGRANFLGLDLLFPDPGEKGRWPYSRRKIQCLMKKVCREVGLRPRNPHDLRHTYATTLLMAHQSPAYVQKQLGHSSFSITVDIYGHWFDQQGRDGLEEVFRPTHI